MDAAETQAAQLSALEFCQKQVIRRVNLRRKRGSRCNPFRCKDLPLCSCGRLPCTAKACCRCRYIFARAFPSFCAHMHCNLPATFLLFISQSLPAHPVLQRVADLTADAESREAEMQVECTAPTLSDHQNHHVYLKSAGNIDFMRGCML